MNQSIHNSPVLWFVRLVKWSITLNDECSIIMIIKNKKTFAVTVNCQLFNNNKNSDFFGWRCFLINRPINNNKTSIKHVTAAAVGGTWWWWIEHKVRSSRALILVLLHCPGWGDGKSTRARRVDGKGNISEGPGRCPRWGVGGGGVWPIVLGLSTYWFPPLSAVFGSIFVSPFLFFYPYGMNTS